jgi:hypothetical protein
MNNYSYFTIGIVVGILQYLAHYLKEKTNNLNFIWLKLYIDAPITLVAIFIAIAFYHENVYISLAFFIDTIYHIIEGLVYFLK